MARPKGISHDELSNSKQLEMFLVWIEDRNVSEVARRCGINARTVDRYRKKYDWDGRLQRLSALEDMAGGENARALRARRLLEIQQLIEATRAAINDGNYNAITGYDKLIKLEQQYLAAGRDDGEGPLQRASERFRANDGVDAGLDASDYEVTADGGE